MKTRDANKRGLVSAHLAPPRAPTPTPTPAETPTHTVMGPQRSAATALTATSKSRREDGLKIHVHLTSLFTAAGFRQGSALVGVNLFVCVFLQRPPVMQHPGHPNPP